MAGGLLPVSSRSDRDDVAAWVVGPDGARTLADGGVAGWRITLEDVGSSEDVLDALTRSGPAFLSTGRSRVGEAVSMATLPGLHQVAVSVFVDTVDQAVAAVETGAGDLMLRGWDSGTLGELRDALAPRLLVERTALPLGTPIDEARSDLSRELYEAWLQQIDGSSAARPRYEWAPGRGGQVPVLPRRLSAEWSDEAWLSGSQGSIIRPCVAAILERSRDGIAPTRDEIEMLFGARGDEVDEIAAVADELRRRAVGDTVTYVANRNINYTNQCYFRCGFCAFSKGPRSLNLRGDPYLLEVHEVAFRAREAADLGATEVCLQGGIHPDFTGDFYVSVVEAIKEAVPGMHIHGFTPLEVWQGAETLGVTVRDFLTRLRDAGLGTLPGTAAEILDDRVREHLCPDKIRTAQWAEVMLTAHDLGLRSTATIMFGHIDDPVAWANHFEVVREVQRRSGGFTEFVPLPFIHMGAPIWLRGRARPGPTWDEVILVHAIARIAFDGLIPNIQASWVKLGLAGGAALLRSGCNDMGGTLMDENISRAAGADHGQVVTAVELEAAITAAGRMPMRRTTLYEGAASVTGQAH
ncbi:5-amino-6-(D-ribitylamino)uracil--L-tyrosine 4-hydroxyphenyl transferase CofH [bacterium]|nr:5-amino-6-(D-ribitylamino)uracil--L-tyrosine 4-hydroxyphenyl transferase CofH [bacterium]